MLKKHPLNLFLLTLAGLCLAATPVKVGDLVEVELGQFVNARASGNFLKETQNVHYVLHPGTRASVEKVQRFSKTGNYGVCLKVVNADLDSNQPCYWVYYIPARPHLKLFTNETENSKLLEDWKSNSKKVSVSDLKKSGLKIEQTAKPETAQLAEVVREIKAQRDPDSSVAVAKAVRSPVLKGVDLPPAAAPAPVKALSAPLEETVILQATALNSKVGPAMSNPSTQTAECKDCSVKLNSYEPCTEKNSYLEKEITAAENDPTSVINKLLSTSQSAPAKFIKDSCFQLAMQSSGGPFKHCGPTDQQPHRSVGRACVSRSYTNLMRSSFDTVAECLGDFLSGNPNTANHAVADMFALMSWESGLHINARSRSGAGGSGQLTGNAIEQVRLTEHKLLLSHLNSPEKSANPRCQLLKEVMQQPMQPSFAKSCERIGLAEGNPLKNMATTFAYQHHIRRGTTSFITENRLAKSIFTKLSMDDKDYLDRQLTMWAHNTGPGTITQAFSEYARSYVGATLTNRADIKKFFHNMRRHVKGKDGSRANPEEPVQFLKNLNEKMDTLNKNAGDGSCRIQ